MAAEIRAGGCERCGRSEHVSYVHWQFLCAECRDILEFERVQEHARAERLERLEQERLSGAGVRA